MGKKYKNYKKSRLDGWGCLLLFFAIGILVTYWYIVIPVGFAIAYFFYRDKIHAFLLRDEIKRLRELIYTIHSGYEKRQHLLEEKGDSKASRNLTAKLTNDLRELEGLTNKTKKYLDDYTYQEAVDTLHLKYQLQDQAPSFDQNSDSSPNNPVTDPYESQIFSLAPEIFATYQNVQSDHLAIQSKLSKMDLHNQEELTAIHEANMNRFNDILEGYLKIKQSPKDYFNAEERLNLAKQALENFDQELDDTLKQFNEADMQDFEVSLRMMMKKQEKGHDA